MELKELKIVEMFVLFKCEDNKKKLIAYRLSLENGENIIVPCKYEEEK
jgi:hypothetical protein